MDEKVDKLVNGKLVGWCLEHCPTTGLFWKMRQSMDREAYEKLPFLRKAPCCMDRGS
jgi:hypothetical protein